MALKDNEPQSGTPDNAERADEPGARRGSERANRFAWKPGDFEIIKKGEPPPPSGQADPTARRNGVDLVVEDRRIFLFRGARSQTVNVCTPDNQRGRYQSVFRLPASIPIRVADIAKHTTLAGLEEMLIEHGGHDEGPRDAGRSTGTPRTAPTVPAVQLGDMWLNNAIRTTEIAIDALMWEFIEHPYLHRVEESLHARLFCILTAQPIFAYPLPIGSSGRFTQPIHREWPETVSRSEKGGRRDNFDFAILTREQLATATVEQFLGGRIAPSILIEMGLDYPLSHLRADHEMLVNSQVVAGFLVHFGRRYQRDLATEQYLLDSSRHHRTAYAHHAEDGTCTYKTLDGPVRQTRTL